MANIKFSAFDEATNVSAVQEIVGYNGTQNVRITPANFVTTGGTGVFLPLAGGALTGSLGIGAAQQAWPLEVKGADTDGSVLARFYSNTGSRGSFIIRNGSGVDPTAFIGTSGGSEELSIGTNNTEALRLGASQNATFAGTIDSGTITSTGIIKTATTFQSTGGSMLFFVPNVGQALEIAQNTGDATFSSTATATSFISSTDSGININGFTMTRVAANSAIRVSDGLETLGLLRSYAGLNVATTGTFGGDIQGAGVYVGATNTSFDFYNQGTSYFNGTVTVDAAFTQSGGDASTFSGNVTLNGAGDPILDIYRDSGGNHSIRLHSEGVSWINNNSFFGIGTISPSSKLDIQQETAGNIISTEFDNLDYTAGNRNAIKIRQQASSSGSFSAFLGATQDGKLFLSNDSITSDHLVIDNTGNVGIGTASPQSGFKLDVGGNVITRGNAYVLTNLVHYGSSDFLINASAGSTAIKFETGGSESTRITSGGNVLFGTTEVPNGTSVYGSGFIPVSNGKVALRMASSSTGAGTLIEFFNPNGSVGNITSSASATAYNTNSDYRLKEDLQDFDGLDKVSKIPVYDFKWKTDDSRSYGVMAHELQDVLPDAVTGDKDAEKMQGVDYSKIVPLLIKSIQELKAEVELLKNK